MLSEVFYKVSIFFRKPSTCQLSKKEINDAKKPPSSQEFERCIICGGMTCVAISTPIDKRENYEIGCGQLCDECAKKQQKANMYENALTNEQILLVVKWSRNNSGQ